ncbi:MAG: 2-isopropylmalate synthase [Actinobacteria bacterium]|nr:2-isopropylmalate synthase [Actinomycetota bacterium]
MHPVRVFDTTLRDGEQAAGGALTIEEKLEIGRQLARLHVDVIEAGFPHTSPGDFKAVELLAKELRGVEVAALSGFRHEQIDSTWQALKGAERPLLHVVISTSDIHLKHQLHQRREHVVDLTRDAVRYARQYTSHIEFSAMDATRSDLDFVCVVFKTAIAAGATVVNFPDTVGYAQPPEFGRMVRYVLDHTPGIERVMLSVHCHDDLGQAVANSLAAIKEGARQVEGTINGVGERAGNAAYEEIVMALRTRRDFYAADTRVVATELARTSRLVAKYMSMPVPPNKAVVGANAFAHSSGLHQDGMLKERTTYEIMNPRDVGVEDSSIVLGKTSGRHAFRDRLERLGYSLAEEEFLTAFRTFKEIADRKKEITDRDIEAIVQNQLHRTFHQAFELDFVQVTCGSDAMPTATVRLKTDDGRIVSDAATGDGPVDAVYQCINRIVNVPNRLTEFSVQSVTEGIDAIGEVTIRIESEGKTFSGHGAATDIIVASTQAYVNALNRLLAGLGKDWSTTPEAQAAASAKPV